MNKILKIILKIIAGCFILFFYLMTISGLFWIDKPAPILSFIMFTFGSIILYFVFIKPNRFSNRKKNIEINPNKFSRFKFWDYQQRYYLLKKSIKNTSQLEVAELNELIEVKKIELDKQNKQLSHSKSETTKLGNKIIDLKEEIKTLNDKIISINDQIEMETLNLYNPTYTFAYSLGYKEKLYEIRNKQKEMIRNKKAALSEKDWVVDGSKRKGKTLANQSIRQILRSFNNEAEVVISKVSYRNYDNSRKRILRSFEQLNKMNAGKQIRITKPYLNLKLDELDLAFAYEQKKQEEKEILREEREREREEKRLQKEIERKTAILQKDITHYQNMQNELEDRLKKANNDIDKQRLSEELKNLKQAMVAKEKEKEELDYRAAHASAGYVYIISNIGSFGKNVMKIGVTRRLNPYERISELSSASVPFRFDIHAMIFSFNAYQLESELHERFNDLRVNKVNNRKEFFYITPKEIEKVLEEYKDLTIDFNLIPEAEEYHETQKLNNKNNKI